MRPFAFVLVTSLVATPALAQSPEDQVRSVIKRLFDGARAHDTMAIRGTLYESARLLGTGTNQQGQPTHRWGTMDNWLRSVGRSQRPMDERIYDPEVRIDGNLATVWTRYEFFVGENFSHCGIDAYQLVNVGGSWKIIQAADTQRRSPERCGRGSAPVPETKPTAADTAAVVTAVQNLFDAMLKRDTAAILNAFVPSGQLFALGPDRSAPRISTLSVFASAIGRASTEMHERMVAPEVRISDNLATVWAWYDFHRGAQFSHCGVDAVQLVRAAEGWKIAQIGYTTRPSPCEQPHKD